MCFLQNLASQGKVVTNMLLKILDCSTVPRNLFDGETQQQQHAKLAWTSCLLATYVRAVKS